MTDLPLFDRRQLLRGGGAALALGLAGAPAPAAASVATDARIVIVGAGAAGTALANRLSAALRGARIVLVDRRETHHYQPGYTLVGTGLWEPGKVLSAEADHLPRSVEWVREMVAEYDPDANRVVTDTGRSLDYDFLVVASGLSLEFERIEGMDAGLVGREGIGCVYSDPVGTWPVLRGFVENGGVGLFGRPAGDIKCAGAPLKVTFLALDRAVRAGTRARAEFVYNADSDALFSVPVFHDIVERRFGELGVAINRRHVLTAVDPGRREATYATPEGPVTLGYDFLHLVPPMAAPAPLRDSPLAWQEGRFEGWLEVERDSLRHRRYPNVFGAGDVLGVPRGKTAASVKAQVPVVTENLVSVISGREPTRSYDGYTSCPLITRIGSAMLVEFDYEGRLTPTFPFIDPTREGWLPWMMKDRMLRPAYYAMLHGRI